MTDGEWGDESRRLLAEAEASGPRLGADLLRRWRVLVGLADKDRRPEPAPEPRRSLAVVTALEVAAGVAVPPGWVYRPDTFCYEAAVAD